MDYVPGKPSSLDYGLLEISRNFAAWYSMLFPYLTCFFVTGGDKDGEQVGIDGTKLNASTS